MSDKENNWPGYEVRDTFLKFFENEKRKHKRLPSFPLIPANDPSLLWVTAGMSPFKAEFAGIAKPAAPRITTCQKCLRADDIEKVGHTTRHHTFFEMLGNFSFGDYFKEEAITWAYELLTREYKIPPEKLFVSVYPDDEEAYQIWKNIGIPSERLFRLDDNWWGPIGKTGTCGPDTEIYYDRGIKYGCGDPDCKPGCERMNPSGEPCDQYIEIWNLVFTMYHKDEKGKLHELPQKNIDTGAGLERLTMILQGKDSPYDTDLFKSIYESLAPIGSNPKVQISARIAADHLRASLFMISDGAVPSNEGRGYVLRKILRRAYLYFRNLPVQTDSISKYALYFIDLIGMDKIYPELREKRDIVKQAIEKEISEFKKLLENCEAELWNLAWEKYKSTRIIPGEVLFRLHDEKGFPFEVAKELLENEGFHVDESGFQIEMEKQRERSRASRQGIVDLLDTAFAHEEIKKVVQSGSDAAQAEVSILQPTHFLGYETLEADGKILFLQKILENKKHETTKRLISGENGVVILDRTPFYAESGGQIGDTGILIWGTGQAKILDTQKNEGGYFFHSIQVEIGDLKTGEVAKALVDVNRRDLIRKHHTATHLLHAALREILGPHVQQAGSYVCDTYLRLDFSHPQAISSEELLKIESLVNKTIQKNLTVETVSTTPEKAKELGALAFFGEKYGEAVRAVLVDGFSKELCGGTHVHSVGEIGFFVLLKESSISKGMRRLEAKAGEAALLYFQEFKKLKIQEEEMFKLRLEDKEKEIRSLRQELASKSALSLKEKIQNVGGIMCVIEKVETENKESLRTMMDTLKKQLKSGIILLASPVEGKLSLICGVTSDLIKLGFSAVELIRPVAKILDGGGGGKADLAEAGGKNIEKLEEAFDEAKKLVGQKVALSQQKRSPK